VDTKSVSFFNKYVKPYYGGLMNLNFMRKEFKLDPVEFLKEVIALERELSHQEIRGMVSHENWRLSKVGAWIIGLCNIYELERGLIQQLQSRPIYSEHIIINLTLLNTPSGRMAILAYTRMQLEEILKWTSNDNLYEAIEHFERSSIIWAFNAIKQLDILNSSDDFKNLLSSETWSSLRKHWKQKSEFNRKALRSNDFLQSKESEDLGFEKLIKLIGKL